MKTFNRVSLPDTIKYNGRQYKMETNVNAVRMKGKTITSYVMENNKKYVQVNVLSRKLKQATNLYGRPYEPTKWLYAECK